MDIKLLHTISNIPGDYLSFSPDGTHFACASGNQLHVYNAYTFEKESIFLKSETIISNLLFIDNNVIQAGLNRYLVKEKKWLPYLSLSEDIKMKVGNQQGIYDLHYAVNDKDNQYLIIRERPSRARKHSSISKRCRIIVTDKNAQTYMREIFPENKVGLYQFLLPTASDIFIGGTEQILQVNKTDWTLSKIYKPYSGNTIGLLASGNNLFSAGIPSMLVKISISDQREVKKIDTGQQLITSLCLLGDNLLATSGEDHRILFYNNDLEVLKSIETTEIINTLAASPDGKFLLAYSALPSPKIFLYEISQL